MGPRRSHHRPRQYVRRLGLLQGVQGRRRQPGHRHRGRTWPVSRALSARCAAASRRHGGDVDGGQKLYYHLTLLAETTAGYRNLLSCRLPPTSRVTTTSPGSTGSCSSATTRASSPPPAASAGWSSRRWLAGDPARAEALAGAPGHLRARQPLRRDPGPRHRRPAQDQPPADRDRQAHRRAAARHQRRHYTHRADAVAHDALLCVQTGATIDDPKRFKFEGSEHYLKTAAEMRHLFAEVPDPVTTRC